MVAEGAALRRAARRRRPSASRSTGWRCAHPRAGPAPAGTCRARPIAPPPASGAPARSRPAARGSFSLTARPSRARRRVQWARQLGLRLRMLCRHAKPERARPSKPAVAHSPQPHPSDRSARSCDRRGRRCRSRGPRIARSRIRRRHLRPHRALYRRVAVAEGHDLPGVDLQQLHQLTDSAIASTSMSAPRPSATASSR